MIWFAPFQGLGDEQPVIRGGDGAGGDDGQWRSSASASTTANAAIPVPSPV
jgi:hypothetical protein